MEGTRHVGVAKSEHPRLTKGEIILKEFQPICKIFESILRDSITAHFQVNKLFTNRHSDLLKVDLQFFNYLKFLMTGHFTSRKVVNLT